MIKRCISICLLVTYIKFSQAVDWEYFMKNQVDITRISNVAPRIIKGKPTDRNEFKFHVGIFINNETFCGGSLISHRYVLTTAKCAYKMNNTVEVVLGAHNITEHEPDQIRCEVKQIIVHKDFNTTSKQNDVALLKLVEKIKFTRTIGPVELLPPKEALDINYQAQKDITSIGWGRNSDYHYPPRRDLMTLSDIAHKLEVKIISTDACKQRWNRGVEYVNEKNLCTSGYRAVGACRMDDGSPLLMGNLLIGMFSMSSIACEMCAPSVYTNLRDYYEWIYENSDLLKITYN